MRFVQPFVLFALFPTLLFGKKADPKNYTQTATVASVSSESKETGAAIRNDFNPCSAVAPIRRKRCESQRQASKTVTTKSVFFVRISGEFNNMEYAAVGRCFLRPGTYKVLADGLEIRFLTKGKRGKPAECQFRIIEERQQPVKSSGKSKTPGLFVTVRFKAEKALLRTTAEGDWSEVEFRVGKDGKIILPIDYDERDLLHVYDLLRKREQA